ncbi:leucyl aminopeptidase [Arthrobacter psychrolactophilus]|uniref:Probable cytosol aminopeptidase n=1 Tax=Arthrobacter psychrolactophilus TaxID=92442 RepID=A0A2V5JNG3_9MICC|nr:leucyl aminopeptidase [Arthrobacter psychrolactophilus]PYI39896.1 leucyl aminopeptidase [Arthrobacter psychrolactophilus]
MAHSPNKLIPESYDPAPSLGLDPTVSAVAAPSGEVSAVAYFVSSDGEVPAEVGLDRVALVAAGFTGAAAQTLYLPGDGTTAVIAVGAGGGTARTVDELRDVAAAFARAAARHARIAVVLPEGHGVDGTLAGQAVVEGVLLARYRYSALKSAPKDVAVERLEIIGAGEGAAAGAVRGKVLARSAALARDLANNPPGHLTAVEYADFATEQGPQFGLGVESFDKAQLIEMGCGGLLGVNAGSVEEPRLIVLRYVPEGEPTGHVALVGKGIMYDSGGISLKPSDPMHLAMKMDMAGSAAVLAAMTGLRDLGAMVAVSAWLVCTDNMPSGTATKLGDVLTARNGTTVEVKNTDAEGRLVMMDALCLAMEEKPDAIVDIATLTGAAMAALGTLVGATLGNDQPLIEQLKSAAEVSGESLWQLPLEASYRAQLDSDIADISNMGGPTAGAITAALFLSEFVKGTPWAHLDIAGTMKSDIDDSWRSRGATGYGTRLLSEFLASYSK